MLLDFDSPRNLLLLAMASHMAWTTLLYGLLTLVRAPSVWGIGAGADGSNPWDHLEPRVSANLSNQFEWPLFFHLLGALMLLGDGPLGPEMVALAWLFVGGRVLHSAVQILTDNVRLRGIVFTINFLAVIAMWGWLLLP